VVLAALGLLDDAGLDERTMRRLAQRLGVKAASLYRHVRDKDELLVLLADEICAEIPTDIPAGAWQTQLAEIARLLEFGLPTGRAARQSAQITRVMTWWPSPVSKT